MNRRRTNPPSSRCAIKFVITTAILFSLLNSAFSQDVIIKLKVVAEQANIRLKPDISSIIIRQVPKGTILDSKGKEDDWFVVLLLTNQETSISGYVHESLVAVIEPPPQRKKRPEKIEETIPPPPPKTAETDDLSLPSPFNLTIMGGGVYVAGGDLNPGIQGLAGLYGDILGIQGEGNIDPAHFGYALDINFLFPLSSQLSWGIGLEFLQAKNRSSVDFRQGSVSHTLHTLPYFNAIPLSLFLVGTPLTNLYVRGGISFTFARYSYLYQILTEDWIQEWEGNANAQGLGLIGGLGFTKKIAPSLNFVAEGTGRLIRLSGFKGKGSYKDESGQTLTEEGKLYFIQNQVVEQRTHNTLFIRRTKPNEAGIIGAREAQINFSGISLRIGLRFYF